MSSQSVLLFSYVVCCMIYFNCKEKLFVIFISSMRSRAGLAITSDIWVQYLPHGWKVLFFDWLIQKWLASIAHLQEAEEKRSWEMKSFISDHISVYLHFGGYLFTKHYHNTPKLIVGCKDLRITKIIHWP